MRNDFSPFSLFKVVFRMQLPTYCCRGTSCNVCGREIRGPLSLPVPTVRAIDVRRDKAPSCSVETEHCLSVSRFRAHLTAVQHVSLA